MSNKLDEARRFCCPVCDAVVSADAGRTLASATVADLGRARRVTVGKDTTTFVQSQGDAAKQVASPKK